MALASRPTIKYQPEILIPLFAADELHPGS
jgi:hypothetical protein